MHPITVSQLDASYNSVAARCISVAAHRAVPRRAAAAPLGGGPAGPGVEHSVCVCVCVCVCVWALRVCVCGAETCG